MNKIDIKLIFNNTRFQMLLDALAASTGLAILATDYTGKPISKHSGITDFCKMVRNDPNYSSLCEKCDSRGGLEAVRTGSPYIYICHSGIVDFAIPITYEGVYLGAILAGEILLSDDENFYGGLEQVYIDSKLSILREKKFREAYQRLPKMSKEKIQLNADMLANVCSIYLELEIIKHINGHDKTIEKNTNSVATQQPRNNILTPVYDYIDRNICQNLSLNHVARENNISPNYLSRLFKKYNGVTISQYINQKKIEYAKNLLISTDMSVQEIALKIGYNDCSYFIKVFKSYVGVSPKTYKQQNDVE